MGDVKHFSLESEPTFDVYLPVSQIHEDGVSLVANSNYWIVRSVADRKSLEAAFYRELQGIDRDVATSNIRTMEDYVSDSVAPRRFSLRVISIFSLAALLLAAMGIYGMVSYTVSQRTPEIGIRLALGAGQADVFGLVLGQGLKVVLIGLGLGLLSALAVTRVIRSLLFGTTPNDTVTFAFVSLLMIVVALIAGSVPARRATKVDPLVALRNE